MEEMQTRIDSELKTALGGRHLELRCGHGNVHCINSTMRGLRLRVLSSPVVALKRAPNAPLWKTHKSSALCYTSRLSPPSTHRIDNHACWIYHTWIDGRHLFGLHGFEDRQLTSTFSDLPSSTLFLPILHPCINNFLRIDRSISSRLRWRLARVRSLQAQLKGHRQCKTR